jgi:peptide/nickel transport system substrate-binding protein
MLEETMKTLDGRTVAEGLTRRDLGLIAGATALTAGAGAFPGSALAQGRRGGSINVATVGEPPTLDPMDSPADVVGMIAQHMFETLYARDENARPVPDLATGVNVSADGLTYVFTLRQGVKFHNGRDMVPADVVASLERYRKLAAERQAA